jgi:GTP-binding protein
MRLPVYFFAMLRIATAEFVTSAARPQQFPTGDLPEVAFVGRSNVGKSSLLNVITGRRSLARTSSTPGMTRLINFFRINGSLHFVDLPGYGYARVSKTEREAWVRLIESYLTTRPQLRLVVALSDIRHETPAADRDLFAWLDSIQRTFVVVLTKYDKLSAAQADRRLDEARDLVSPLKSCIGIIAVSARTCYHRDELLALIESNL